MPERVAVVTGGGTGIGRAITEALVAVGTHVVVIGRREEPLRSVADALRPYVSVQTANVSRRDDVVAAVQAIMATQARIDVLVNNAGFSGNRVATDVPLPDAERTWDEVMNTNLKGAFLMAMAVAPHLPRPGGRIINISSIAALTGGSRAGSAAYAASKAGVIGLTYGLARELSPLGITVNAIAPGFIANTEFTGGWPSERVDQIIAETAARRAGTPSDIGAAVAYLASPQASFVTGEILNVNGGWVFGR